MSTESVFINGTVGAGKSTVASRLGDLLAASNVAHAVIDLDYIRTAWPAPANDYFNHELELRNLTAIVGNYRDASAQRFVIAGVLEDPGEIARYRAALGDGRLFLCRLTARPSVLRARLQERHQNNSADLDWHLKRVGELDAILRVSDHDDYVFDTSTRTPAELAADIKAAVGW